ncbi:hypothetical protein OQA88_13616 [Cercophora sp. LCS_1]
MNNRGHLPAGQPMQGGVADMGPGSGGGRRGGRPHQNQHQQHQPYPNAHHYHHHSINQGMYPPGYMAPYGGAPPYYVQPHYQNNPMVPQGYMPYPPGGYNRSPPSMQHYAPMVPQSHNPYARPPQSPVVPPPFQTPPPPVHIPIPPHTPSSTHSFGGPPPPPMTPPVAQPLVVPQAPVVEPHFEVPVPPQPSAELQDVLVAETKEPSLPPVEPQSLPESSKTGAVEISPFRPPLPWLSSPDSPFPSRPPRSRRRRKALDSSALKREDIEQQAPSTNATPSNVETRETSALEKDVAVEQPEEEVGEETTPATPKAASSAPTQEVARSETPSTQDQPSEDAPSTSPTTPSSVHPSQSAGESSITVATKPVKAATRSAVPAVPALPLIPVLPKASPKDMKPTSGSEKGPADSAPAATAETKLEETQETPETANGLAEEPKPAPAPAKPTSWANLFAKPAPVSTGAASAATYSAAQTNGTGAVNGSAAGGSGGFGPMNASSITEALQAYRVGASSRLAYLEPRGLFNTGNVCYMNSVLQVLIFCVPFFDFLDQVSKKLAFSFKSETPLLDAMINFMREFKVIHSATSVEQLQKRLKPEELERYGESFIPQFVYDAIGKLPRFADMKRGHQQDAEEFLGFLLEGLHDECAHIMRGAPASTSSTSPNSSLPSPTSSVKGGDDDWLEVGPRQRPAITRSSGHSTISSPITRIFGGLLRSELRVPGLKNSVTLEPYQPLQLDIGPPEVRNIVDALRAIPRSEIVTGNFNSPRGPEAKATKQVFIESLPPVLILHLKRFQYVADGSTTVKIWKKIGYPLELEIPRDVLSPQKRKDAPRYKLTAVVYHHGKNASVGHYTVDVRRQDSREWIRINDTHIERVRSEDVAEGGAEEDIKAGHASDKKDNAPANRFAGIGNEDAGGDDDGWKQATAGGKKWSAVANGASQTTTNGVKPKPAHKEQHKESVKDNKVAYLLFYQRI